MSFEALPERLAQVRAEIARLASQPGTIVALTKRFRGDRRESRGGSGGKTGRARLSRFGGRGSVASDRPPAAEQSEARARSIRARAFPRFARARDRVGQAGVGLAGVAAGERGGRSTEVRLHGGRGAAAGPTNRGARQSATRRTDDVGPVYRRRGRAAPDLPGLARPA